MAQHHEQLVFQLKQGIRCMMSPHPHSLGERVFEDNQGNLLRCAWDNCATASTFRPTGPGQMGGNDVDGWEFTLHIDRLGQILSRPYLPDSTILALFDRGPSLSALIVHAFIAPFSIKPSQCMNLAVWAMRQEDVRSVHVHVNDAGQPQRGLNRAPSRSATGWKSCFQRRV